MPVDQLILGPLSLDLSTRRMSWRAEVEMLPNPPNTSHRPLRTVYEWGTWGSYLKLKLSTPSLVLGEGCHLTPKITGPPQPSSCGYSGPLSDPPVFP